MQALTFLAAGCIFGLAGGFSPGPTTTVVVSQTLRFGFLDGIKVAIAPALTDAPIILVAVLLVGQLTRFEPILGIISIFGAVFLLYLAYESFRVRGIEIDDTEVEPRSIRKGFMANLLNPHPYFRAVVSCLSVNDNGKPTVVNVRTRRAAANILGDAAIVDDIDLPRPCVAPIVFVTAPRGQWLAASGR